MSAARLRIGGVSYLNTRPLCLGFDQGIAADRVSIEYAVPAELARRMEAGLLDVALLPTIELARIPGLWIVPGLGISSFGPALSVLLFSKRPLPEVRRVALDPESRTTNALVQVLFAEAWSGSAEFVAGPPGTEDALDDADAVVRIGDKALFDPPPPGTMAIDLGEAWWRRTGLPFVFAVWAAKADSVDRALYREFHASRRAGQRQIDLIADDYTWRGERHPELCRRYLRDHMRYRLGAQEVAAMRSFLAAASRLGLCDTAALPPISFRGQLEKATA